MKKNKFLASAVVLILVDQLVTNIVVVNFSDIIHNNPFFQFAPYSWVGALIILFLLKNRSQLGSVFLGAGLISNIISYLSYGYYIDYIPTGFSFVNGADIMVSIGCLLFLIKILWPQHRLFSPKLPK